MDSLSVTFAPNAVPAQVTVPQVKREALLGRRISMPANTNRNPDLSFSIREIRNYIFEHGSPLFQQDCRVILIGSAAGQQIGGPQHNDFDFLVPIPSLTAERQALGKGQLEAVFRSLLKEASPRIYGVTVKAIPHPHVGWVVQLGPEAQVILKPDTGLRSLSCMDSWRFPLDGSALHSVIGSRVVTDPDELMTLVKKTRQRDVSGTVIRDPEAEGRLSRLLHYVGHGVTILPEEVQWALQELDSVSPENLCHQIAQHQKNHFPSPSGKTVDYLNFLTLVQHRPHDCRSVSQAWMDAQSLLCYSRNLLPFPRLVMTAPTLVPDLLKWIRGAVFYQFTGSPHTLEAWSFPFNEHTYQPRPFFCIPDRHYPSRYLAMVPPGESCSPSQVVDDFLIAWERLEVVLPQMGHDFKDLQAILNGLSVRPDLFCSRSRVTRGLNANWDKPHIQKLLHQHFPVAFLRPTTLRHWMRAQKGFSDTFNRWEEGLQFEKRLVGLTKTLSQPLIDLAQQIIRHSQQQPFSFECADLNQLNRYFDAIQRTQGEAVLQEFSQPLKEILLPRIHALLYQSRDAATGKGMLQFLEQVQRMGFFSVAERQGLDRALLRLAARLQKSDWPVVRISRSETFLQKQFEGLSAQCHISEFVQSVLQQPKVLKSVLNRCLDPGRAQLHPVGLLIITSPKFNLCRSLAKKLIGALEGVFGLPNTQKAWLRAAERIVPRVRAADRLKPLHQRMIQDLPDPLRASEPLAIFSDLRQAIGRGHYKSLAMHLNRLEQQRENIQALSPWPRGLSRTAVLSLLEAMNDQKDRRYRLLAIRLIELARLTDLMSPPECEEAYLGQAAQLWEQSPGRKGLVAGIKMLNRLMVRDMWRHSVWPQVEVSAIALLQKIPRDWRNHVQLAEPLQALEKTILRHQPSLGDALNQILLNIFPKPKVRRKVVRKKNPILKELTDCLAVEPSERLAKAMEVRQKLPDWLSHRLPHEKVRARALRDVLKVYTNADHPDFLERACLYYHQKEVSNPEQVALHILQGSQRIPLIDWPDALKAQYSQFLLKLVKNPERLNTPMIATAEQLAKMFADAHQLSLAHHVFGVVLASGRIPNALMVDRLASLFNQAMGQRDWSQVKAYSHWVASRLGSNASLYAQFVKAIALSIIQDQELFHAKLILSDTQTVYQDTRALLPVHAQFCQKAARARLTELVQCLRTRASIPELSDLLSLAHQYGVFTDTLSTRKVHLGFLAKVSLNWEEPFNRIKKHLDIIKKAKSLTYGDKELKARLHVNFQIAVQLYNQGISKSPRWDFSDLKTFIQNYLQPDFILHSGVTHISARITVVNLIVVTCGSPLLLKRIQAIALPGGGVKMALPKMRQIGCSAKQLEKTMSQNSWIKAPLDVLIPSSRLCLYENACSILQHFSDEQLQSALSSEGLIHLQDPLVELLKLNATLLRGKSEQRLDSDIDALKPVNADYQDLYALYLWVKRCLEASVTDSADRRNFIARVNEVVREASCDFDRMIQKFKTELKDKKRT